MEIGLETEESQICETLDFQVDQLIKESLETQEDQLINESLETQDLNEQDKNRLAKVSFAYRDAGSFIQRTINSLDNVLSPGDVQKIIFLLSGCFFVVCFLIWKLMIG